MVVRRLAGGSLGARGRALTGATSIPLRAPVKTYLPFLTDTPRSPPPLRGGRNQRESLALDERDRLAIRRAVDNDDRSEFIEALGPRVRHHALRRRGGKNT